LAGWLLGHKSKFTVGTRQSWIAYFTHVVHSHPPFSANNAFSMGKKTPSRW